MPLLANGINETEPLGAARVDGAAGQHERHRLHRIDQPREARGATEAGMQAEHHLGEAEPRVRYRDARLAGQRHFEPAAEAEAVDHGDVRHAQRFETIDHRMRARNRGFDHGRIGRAAEFIDVGAGDESGCFRRTDDEAGRARAFELSR